MGRGGRGDLSGRGKEGEGGGGRAGAGWATGGRQEDREWQGREVAVELEETAGGTTHRLHACALARHVRLVSIVA